MSTPLPTNKAVLSWSVRQHVDQVCDQFEDAWRAGKRPRTADYLGDTPEPQRSVLLGHLLRLDVEYRIRSGDHPTPQEYQADLGAFGPLIEHVLQEMVTVRGPQPIGAQAPDEAEVGAGRCGSGEAGSAGEHVAPVVWAMRVRCPHCQNPIQLADGRSDEVLCPACGNSFQLRDTRQTVTPAPMRRVGRFQLLERVGMGGMGAVWRARDTVLDKIVALKIPHASLLESHAERQRFDREARAASQLRHPGIVPVHEVAELETDAGHLPTIVSDFIDGLTLRELLEIRALRFREAAELVAQVAEALDHAHTRGVVHRDLKPANIMLEYPPGVGLSAPLDADSTVSLEPGGPPRQVRPRPMIMDFGLALRADAESLMTLDGQVLGTPAYMSPEQAEGKSHRLDARSDVWTLGVILYELLTGGLPFLGSPAALMRQIQFDEPPAPRRVNRKIPRDLETICLKATAKAPGHRYGTARELADDLRRWLNEEPIRARPVGTIERLYRSCRRNPKLASLAGALVLVLVLAAGLLRNHIDSRADGLVARLMDATTRDVPRIIAEMEGDRRSVGPKLRAILADPNRPAKHQLHASLALLPVDTSQVGYLRKQFHSASGEELLVVRTALVPFRDELKQDVWDVARDPAASSDERLRAACVLAAFDPDNEDWDKIKGEVVRKVISENPLVLWHWVEALKPVCLTLLDPLRQAYVDRPSGGEGMAAASVLAEYAGDDPEFLVGLVRIAEPRQLVPLIRHLQNHRDRAVALLRNVLAETIPPPALKSAQDSKVTDPHESPKDELAKLHARAALALVGLGYGDAVWPLLAHSPDPRLRTYLVNQFALAGVDPRVLHERLDSETDTSIRRALLLSLGEYPSETLALEQRTRLVDSLVDTYRADPDPGIHSAVAWLLRRWDQEESLQNIESGLISPAPNDERRWYVNGQGQSLAVVAGPVESLQGSPWYEEWRRADEDSLHHVWINRTFAIATHEVTSSQLRRLFPHHAARHKRFSPEPDCPATIVTWYEAAQYCRWLSEQEGISEDQMCYPPMDQIKPGMKPYPDYLLRTGYRLPTEAEWNYACRAGAVTPRFYGHDPLLMPQYGWHIQISRNLSWPVGRLKPNDLGLFDIHGNVGEWCHDVYAAYSFAPDRTLDDLSDPSPIDDTRMRVLRDASFAQDDLHMRCAQRAGVPPGAQHPDVGFRVARTLYTPGLIARLEQQTARNRVEFKVQGAGTPFVVRNVQGDVRVSPQQGTAPAVVTVMGRHVQTRPFSFLLECPDTGETTSVSGVWKPGGLTFRSDRPPSSRPSVAPSEPSAPSLSLHVGDPTGRGPERFLIGLGDRPSATAEPTFIIKEVSGDVEVSPRRGTMPAVVRVAVPDRRTRPFSFLVERTDTRETVRASGVMFFPEWDVKFYAWEPVGRQRPERPSDWQSAITGQPLAQQGVDQISFDWGESAPAPNVPADYFAVLATTELELPAGTYQLWSDSDEGARVFLDGMEIIDKWAIVDVKLEAGKHLFRIEYFETQGPAGLGFQIIYLAK